MSLLLRNDGVRRDLFKKGLKNMRFKNLATNEIVDAPLEQHSDFLANPNFAPETASNVLVRNEDGQVYENVNLNDARDFVKNNGGQILSPQQSSVEDWQNKFPVLGRVAAGVAGAARGALFGVSDAAANVVPGLREGLSNLEEAFPVVSTAGEIGGAIFSPVGNKLMAGAKLAGEAVAGAKALQTAKPLVQAGVKAAVEAGVRGGAFGAGQAVSDLALEDAPLTAEHIASTMIRDTLIGAGADIGFGGLLHGVSVGLPYAKDFAKKQLGKGIDATGKYYAKAQNFVAGGDEATQKILEKAFTNPEERMKVADAIMHPEKLQTQVIDTVNGFDSFKNAALETAEILKKRNRETLSQKIRSDAVEYAAPTYKTNVITGVGLTEVPGEALPFQILPEFKESFSKAESLVNSMKRGAQKIKEGKGLYNSKTGKQISQTADTLKADLENVKTLADMHLAVENARKTLDSFTDFGLDVAKGVAKETNRVTRDVSSKLRAHLQDDTVYGKFGKQYAAVNEAESEILGETKRFAKLFQSKTTDDTGKEIRNVDPSKILGWLANPEAMRNFRKSDNLDKMAAKIQKLQEVIGEEASDSKAYKASLDKIKDLRNIITGLSEMESSTGKSLFGAILGGSTFGIAGGALGAAVANPKFVLKQLANLDKLAGRKLPESSAIGAHYFTNANALASQQVIKKYTPDVIDPAAQYAFFPGTGFRKITKTLDTNIEAGKTGGGNNYTVDLPDGPRVMNQSELKGMVFGEEISDAVAKVASAEQQKGKAAWNKIAGMLGITPHGKGAQLRRVNSLLKPEGRAFFEANAKIIDDTLFSGNHSAIINNVRMIRDAIEKADRMAGFKRSGNKEIDHVVNLGELEKNTYIKEVAEKDFSGKLDQYAALPKGRVAVDVLAGSIAEGMRNESQRKKLREYLANDDVEGFGSAQENYNTVSPTLSSAASVQAAGVKNWLQNNFPAQRNSLRPGAKEIAPTPIELREFAIKAGAALDPMGSIQRAAEAGVNLHPLALKTIQDLYPRIYLQLISGGSQKALGNDVGGVRMLQDMHKKPAEETPDDNIKAKISAPQQTKTGQISSQ